MAMDGTWGDHVTLQVDVWTTQKLMVLGCIFKANMRVDKVYIYGKHCTYLDMGGLSKVVVAQITINCAEVGVNTQWPFGVPVCWITLLHGIS